MDFLNSITLLTIIWTIIVIAGIIIILLIIKSVLKTKDIKIGKLEIVDDDDDLTEMEETKCNKKIGNILNEFMMYAFEKFKLLYIIRLKEQMNYSEQKMIELNGILRAAFRDAIKNKGIIDENHENPDFELYCLVLEIYEIKLLKSLKKGFEENHYTNMTDIAFENYYKDKLPSLIQIMEIELLSKYRSNKEIFINDIMNSIEKQMDKIEKIFIDIFITARKISKDTETKTNEIDEKLKNIEY